MSDVPVEVVENLFIPLRDGTRLAARLWRPSAGEPVPAILEYIPYRKRDGTRGRDEPMHGFFAREGYAAIRVDMRGSGESDGLLEDEYLKLEQDDALEVIAWLAAQPWCSGEVGMMGKSWGGFNALQVAARRPPALKAVITVCSTDDRFGDDIHFMGGCLLNDNLWWGSIMLAYQGRPPDPAIAGEGWREQWLERLDHMPFWPALAMHHQERDDYWRHGSIGEDFGAIRCPVLVVGGWSDAYTNAVPRMLAGLEVPRLGIVGPWAHIYPQDGSPGPAIDFLDEATRWWDQWLKRRDTGIMAEPMLRAYVQDYVPPATTLGIAPGRFVAEAAWPSPGIVERVLGLAPGQLVDAKSSGAAQEIRSPLWTGTACGEWMGTGVAGEQPADQRIDDGFSLCFDTAPLEADVEILGNPALELQLSSDKAQGQIAVRLCDVAPDGSSLRVSYAVLNLSHRDGSAEPRPLRPGEVTAIRLPLKFCGHGFPAGHRVRVAISTAYWPLIWPAPEAATLTISMEGSRLILPVRQPSGGDPEVRFGPPRHGPKAPVSIVGEGGLERSVGFDLVSGVATYRTVGKGGLFGEGVQRWDEIGTALSHDLERHLTISAEDPLSARATIEQSYTMGRDGWAVRLESTATLSGDATHFRISGTLRAFENGALVRTREWDERIARRNL